MSWAPETKSITIIFSFFRGVFKFYRAQICCDVPGVRWMRTRILISITTTLKQPSLDILCGNKSHNITFITQGNIPILLQCHHYPSQISFSSLMFAASALNYVLEDSVNTSHLYSNITGIFGRLYGFIIIAIALWELKAQ